MAAARPSESARVRAIGAGLRRMASSGPGLASLMLFICLASIACDAVAPPDQEALRRKEASSPWHVRDDFQVLVGLATKGERAGIVQHLEKYLLVESEFIELFGEARGRPMWAGYRDVIAPKLRAEAADVLIKRVNAGMNIVEVERVGPIFPGRTTRGDHAILAAMKRRRPMYTIRIRPDGDQLGLRFNGFVFVQGRWRSLLKSYSFIPEASPEQSPAAPQGLPVPKPLTQEAPTPTGAE